MADVEIKYNNSTIASLNDSGTEVLETNGTFLADDITVEYTKPSAPTPTLQSKSVSYTPTTSQQTASVTADAGYDGLSAVNVTVNAMPSGTAGTPTATKGTVSNHSVSVTPSVTNTTGYITGGTKTGTAVTVSASELVSGTKNITSSGTTDVTNYASASVANGSAATPATTITANPSISVNASGLISATASASQSVTPTVSAGYVSSGTAGTITVSGSNTSQLSTQSAVTATPTESEQTIVSAGKYTTGAIKVGAISSTYIGSGITRRDSTDLTASGATVSVPSGYYEESASKSVASGTAGTPTATKGTASNNSISVTPSVTNTAGYISGGTINGTAVTVSASELVSGTKAITSSGTTDVTNYASASVAAGSASVNASVTVTPIISVSSSGLISASVSSSHGIGITVTEGYIANNTSGTVNVSGSNTSQLTVYSGALRGA